MHWVRKQLLYGAVFWLVGMNFERMLVASGDYEDTFWHFWHILRTKNVRWELNKTPVEAYILFNQLLLLASVSYINIYNVCIYKYIII